MCSRDYIGFNRGVWYLERLGFKAWGKRIRLTGWTSAYELEQFIALETYECKYMYIISYKVWKHVFENRVKELFDNFCKSLKNIPHL